MRIDFHIDADSEEPHIHRHGVTCEEVLQVLGRSPFTLRQADGIRVALGQTLAGRYLKIVYRQRRATGILVIAAYPMSRSDQRAYRRRIRQRPS